MTYEYSVVLIIPADLRDLANRLACALGHDTLPGNTFSVPLMAGNDISHYGCHTWAAQSFVDLLEDAIGGTFPDLPLEDFDLSQTDLTEIISNLIVSWRPIPGSLTHWSDVLSAHALTVSGTWLEPMEEEESEPAGFMATITGWGKSAWTSVKSLFNS